GFAQPSSGRGHSESCIDSPLAGSPLVVFSARGSQLPKYLARRILSRACSTSCCSSCDSSMSRPTWLGGRAGRGSCVQLIDLCPAMPSHSVVDRRTIGRKPPHWMARPGSFFRSEGNICCGVGANGAGQAHHCLLRSGTSRPNSDMRRCDFL